jgi:hypothetical protein
LTMIGKGAFGEVSMSFSYSIPAWQTLLVFSSYYILAYSKKKHRHSY